MSRNGPDADTKDSLDAGDCQARGCDQVLPADRLWSCADCAELFCEAHIEDLLDENDSLVNEDERGSVYVCGACRARRLRKINAAA
jgi:hypothetical protein